MVKRRRVSPPKLHRNRSADYLMVKRRRVSPPEFHRNGPALGLTG